MTFNYDFARAMAEDDNSVMVPDIELTLALNEIDRLRAELVVARGAMQGWTDCANGLRAELAEVCAHRDRLMDQRDDAEAAIARVRELCATWDESSPTWRVLRALDGE